MQRWWRRRAPAGACVEVDSDVARALQSFERRLWMLVSLGVAVVAGFVVAATVVDPRDLAPAVDPEQSPSWVGFATSALTVGVIALLVAMLGMVRYRRQRRTLSRSPLRRTSARWAPTRTRGQEVPGLAIEQPDGSWSAVTLALASGLRSFSSRVRLTGSVDVASDGSYLVVRAPGSNALFSAKAKGSVEVAALPAPPGPLITLHAGDLATPVPYQPDDGPWFREVVRTPTTMAHGLFSLLIAGVWISRIGSSSHRGGTVFSIVTIVVVVASGLVVLSSSRTVTIVDYEGVIRRPVARGHKRVSFARITTLERFATDNPRRPTRVGLGLDDGSLVTIETRRPDELVLALRRGRSIA